MSNERFFRTLSVALLGMLALAVVPQTHATDSGLAAEDVPVEVTVVREVDEINAGRFNVFSSDSTGSEDTLVLSPVKTTALSQVDPNL